MTAVLIQEHPWVGHVDVRDGTVLVHPAAGLTELRPVPGLLLHDFLNDWAEIYDWVYGAGGPAPSGDLDFSGWRASDTGQPLPVDHMTEWLDRIAELVLDSRPRTVLELGAGSGLLLHRLHPHLAGYVGTDVSPASVARLSALRLPGTAIVPAAAHEITSDAVRAAFDRIAGPGTAPDCILVNSVTQHFPHAGYLRAVLDAAVALVAPGGTVVIGDIRHAGLLLEHHRWLAAVDPRTGHGDLEQRAAARAGAEKEFLADPRLIASIAAGHERPVAVSLHAKTLRENTELTRYRYDAVLHVAPHEVPDAVEQPWSALPGPDRIGLLRRCLAAEPNLFVTGIPNAVLTTAPDAVTAYELRLAAAGTRAVVGLDASDPTQLTVGAPTSASRPPAAHLTGGDHRRLSHEPFTRYVERRVRQALGDHLRRAGADIPDIRVVQP